MIILILYTPEFSLQLSCRPRGQGLCGAIPFSIPLSTQHRGRTVGALERSVAWPHTLWAGDHTRASLGDSLGWKQNQESQLGLGSGLGDSGEGVTGRTSDYGRGHLGQTTAGKDSSGSREQEGDGKGVRWSEKEMRVNRRSPASLPLLPPPLLLVPLRCLSERPVCTASVAFSPRVSAPGWHSHPLSLLPTSPDVSSVTISRLPLPEGVLTPFPKQLGPESWGQ